MNESIVEYIKNCVNQKKDFTIRLNNNNKLEKPIYGYVVSITPLINIEMNLHQMCKYVFNNKVIEINEDTYKLYIGGWLEYGKGKLSTDISIITEKKHEAMQIAKYCKQKAIYDIVNKNTIYLN